MAGTSHAGIVVRVAAMSSRRWRATQWRLAQDEEPPRKRSRGDDLYVFKNSRLPEYKIGRSSDVAARRDALQKSQNFYIQKVAIFEGRGHLEDKVRVMLAYCILPVEVAKGREWHACSLQTALAAIGHAIDGESA